MTVYAFCCFDLGGAIVDAEPALDALRHHGWPKAARSPEFDDAWHTSRLIASPPVLTLGDTEELDLALDGMAGGGGSVVVKVFPEGVVAFQYVLPVAPGRTMADAYRLTTLFDEAYRSDYRSHLRQSSDLSPELAGETDCADAPAESVSMTPTVRALRTCLAPVLNARPHIYAPINVRNAIVVHDVPDDHDCSAALSDLASAKGLRFPPPGQIGGVAPTGRAEPVRIRAWQRLLLASWEGYEVLMVSGEEGDVQAAVQCMEYAHQMGMLVRSWIDILERSAIRDLSGRRYDERALQQLEGDMLELSYLEQLIGKSMMEVRSVRLVFKSPFHLQLMSDYYERFDFAELLALVDSRLETMSRHHSAITSVIERGHQEASRRQGERLQLLFAGSVAASIAVLIPETHAVSGDRTTLVVVATWLLTLALWFGAVFAVKRVWPTIVEFYDARGVSGADLRPGAAPEADREDDAVLPPTRSMKERNSAK